jgi:two-component system response regulator YesN
VYKVLLVDDEELERKVLGFTLQKSGLPIQIIGEASNGREALELVHQIVPDLIIMDIKMPGINGLEATQLIKADYPAIEVIILTAYSKFSYSQKAIRAQAADYLLKPIQPQQLIDAAKRALERLSRKNFLVGPPLDLKSLEEYVKTGNLVEAQREFILLLEHLENTEPKPVTAQINSFGLRVLIIVIQAVLSAGADKSKVSALEHELAQDLSALSSFMTLKTWGVVMLEKCISLIIKENWFNNQALIRKAIDYIKHNYSSDISLDLVAAHVHLSTAYLSRIFNKKMGTSFSDFLAQVRLKEAKRRLRTSDETIDQIAEATGFSSNSYFSAVFKKHEGVTPSEYREKAKYRGDS